MGRYKMLVNKIGVDLARYVISFDEMNQDFLKQTYTEVAKSTANRFRPRKIAGFYSSRNGQYIDLSCSSMFDNLLIGDKRYNFYGVSDRHDVYTDGLKLYSLNHAIDHVLNKRHTNKIFELTDEAELASIHRRLSQAEVDIQKPLRIKIFGNPEYS